MSEYDNAVLIDNPVRYFKGEDLSGSQLTDSSVNEVHSTIDPGAVLGIPGPIETDGTSLAVEGFYGDVSSPSGSDTDFRDNFTLEMWGKADELVGDHGLLARLGQFGLSGSFCVGFNSGTIQARLSDSAGNTYDLAYTSIVVSTYYYIAVVRNDTVLSLQVNDLEFADIDITFPSGPIVRAIYNSAPWVLGALRATVTTGHAFGSDGGARWALYDYALTYARRLAHYEAALNALFISGRSDANPTAILRSDFEPDPVSFPWRHNWTEPLVERISFRSAISQSVTGVEEASGERLTPRRELEFTQVLKSNVERRKLRALLWANQHAKWFVPIRQYAERLLSPLSVSATITPITTTYKDYEDSGYIGFRQIDATGHVEHWEERLITALNPNSVEHEALVHDYAAYRSSCYPVRRALLAPSTAIKGLTDSVEELTVTARLLPEDEAIVPNRITTFTPSIKYRDYEVFDGQLWQSNDWSEDREYEVERALETLDFDTGLIGYESDTAGAEETFSYRMVLSGHENIAAFLGWFYARRGALELLWVPTVQQDFEILSYHIFENQITVRDTNYSDAFALAEARRDLAFIYFDGSMEFRRVIAFEGTVNETLRLDAVLPSFVNLRMVSLLKFCRLDADQLELAWETDDKVVVAWRFREMLHTPEGTGLSSLSPSASRSGSQSPSGSASPSSSVSPSLSASLSASPSSSVSPSSSLSPSSSASATLSPSSSVSLSPSPSESSSPSESVSPSSSASPSA